MASSREHASLHSHLRPHLHVESVSKFDQYRIVEHYVRLRESQQEKLANINLSEELKRKLFGFSEGFYLTNHHDPYKLVIENHPLKGRTIMTEDRYHFQMHNKYKERALKGHDCPSSEIRDFSSEKMYIDSDLEVPFPENSSVISPNPEFNNQSEAALKDNASGKINLDD